MAGGRKSRAKGAKKALKEKQTVPEAVATPPTDEPTTPERDTRSSNASSKTPQGTRISFSAQQGSNAPPEPTRTSARTNKQQTKYSFVTPFKKTPSTPQESVSIPTSSKPRQPFAHTGRIPLRQGDFASAVASAQNTTASNDQSDTGQHAEDGVNEMVLADIADETQGRSFTSRTQTNKEKPTASNLNEPQKTAGRARTNQSKTQSSRTRAKHVQPSSLIDFQDISGSDHVQEITDDDSDSPYVSSVEDDSDEDDHVLDTVNEDMECREDMASLATDMTETMPTAMSRHNLGCDPAMDLLPIDIIQAADNARQDGSLEADEMTLPGQNEHDGTPTRNTVASPINTTAATEIDDARQDGSLEADEMTLPGQNEHDGTATRNTVASPMNTTAATEIGPTIDQYHALVKRVEYLEHHLSTSNKRKRGRGDDPPVPKELSRKIKRFLEQESADIHPLAVDQTYGSDNNCKAREALKAHILADVTFVGATGEMVETAMLSHHKNLRSKRDDSQYDTSRHHVESRRRQRRLRTSDNRRNIAATILAKANPPAELSLLRQDDVGVLKHPLLRIDATSEYETEYEEDEGGQLTKTNVLVPIVPMWRSPEATAVLRFLDSKRTTSNRSWQPDYGKLIRQPAIRPSGIHLDSWKVAAEYRTSIAYNGGKETNPRDNKIHQWTYRNDTVAEKIVGIQLNATLSKSTPSSTICDPLED